MSGDGVRVNDVHWYCVKVPDPDPNPNPGPNSNPNYPNPNPIQTLIQSRGIVDHYGVREREIDAGLDQLNNLFFSLNARKVGR